MGFDLGGALKGSVLGPAGTMAGGFAGDAMNGVFGKAPNKPTYQEDPRAVEARQQQAQIAKQYRDNLGAESQRQSTMAADESRRDLASKMADIKTASNQRGLLYSGLKQGADAGAQSEASSSLNSHIGDINQALEQRAQGLENGAITSGLNATANEQAANGIGYGQNMMENQQRSQAIGGLLSGGGAVAGQMAAKRQNG